MSNPLIGGNRSARCSVISMGVYAWVAIAAVKEIVDEGYEWWWGLLLTLVIAQLLVSTLDHVVAVIRYKPPPADG